MNKKRYEQMWKIVDPQLHAAHLGNRQPLSTADSSLATLLTHSIEAESFGVGLALIGAVWRYLALFGPKIFFVSGILGKAVRQPSFGINRRGAKALNSKRSARSLK